MRWPWQPRSEPIALTLRARRAEDMTVQALAEMRALIAELRELNHHIDKVAPPPERGPLNG